MLQVTIFGVRRAHVTRCAEKDPVGLTRYASWGRLSQLLPAQSGGMVGAVEEGRWEQGTR